MMDKKITVQWEPEDTYGYGKAMRVIESDHPRFKKGCRFDYGFFNIATEEGYTILSLPIKSDNAGALLKEVIALNKLAQVQLDAADMCEEKANEFFEQASKKQREIEEYYEET